MPLRFKRTPQFRKSYEALDGNERNAADDAFEIFRKDPWDPRLKTHKINSLSARYRTTIWSVTILGNLRAVFYVDGSDVVSVDIGTHDIYR